jgi:hypothetical protein
MCSPRRSVASACVGIAAALLSPAAASADPIQIAAVVIQAETSHPEEVASRRGRFTLTLAAQYRLFGDPFDASDVGRTLIADASNEPAFADFARVATNGAGNFTEWIFGPPFGPAPGGGGGVGAASEGVIFGLSTPDFRGFTITSLGLRIDEFSAGPDLEIPGFERLRFRGELAVFGEGAFDPAPVPEPGTFILLGTGALGLARAARRRRAERIV